MAYLKLTRLIMFACNSGCIGICNKCNLFWGSNQDKIPTKFKTTRKTVLRLCYKQKIYLVLQTVTIYIDVDLYTLCVL